MKTDRSPSVVTAPAPTVDVLYRGPDVPDRIVRGVPYPLVYAPQEGETDAVIIGPSPA